MKKLIFLCLLVSISAAGYSQILYGAKAGFNLATFTGNDFEDSHPKLRPSFHIGGFVNFLLSGKISLQPELLYSGKGVRADQGTFKLGYINLPVLVQYNDPTGFFAEAGPQAGLILSAKEKLSGAQTIDVKDNLKSEDFSWVIGLGYKMARGFGVGARYDFGYYDIANSGIIRNKTIMISFLYTFGTSGE